MWAGKQFIQWQWCDAVIANCFMEAARSWLSEWSTWSGAAEAYPDLLQNWVAVLLLLPSLSWVSGQTKYTWPIASHPAIKPQIGSPLRCTRLLDSLVSCCVCLAHTLDWQNKKIGDDISLGLGYSPDSPMYNCGSWAHPFSIWSSCSFSE